MPEEKQKKTIYFVIDASGSMRDRRAGIINTAMRGVFEDVIPDIISNSDNKLELSIAVLLFSDRFPDGVKWIMPKTSMESIANQNETWTDMSNDDFFGGTPTGQGILAVINDCNYTNNGEADFNTVAPAIILITDGGANTGTPSFEDVLEYENRSNVNYSEIFRHSIRVAIGIDVSDSDRIDQLKRFGKVSTGMAARGLKPYYDHSEKYADELIEIIKSVTKMSSQGANIS